MTTTVTIPGRINAFEMTRKLPRVCLVCGGPAGKKPVRRTFHHWHPAVLLAAPLVLIPVALLLAVTGLPPAVAGAMAPAWGMGLMALGRRVKMAAPVCDRHRWVWAWRAAVLVVAFLPALAAGMAAGGYGGQAVAAGLSGHADPGTDRLDVIFGGVIAGLGVGVVGWVGLYLLLRSGTPRLTAADPDGATLAGVSPAFAAAIAAEEAEDDDDRDDTPAPATKPCPHCGTALPRYAEACRRCKRVVAG
jgi:hypothetical protein